MKRIKFYLTALCIFLTTSATFAGTDGFFADEYEEEYDEAYDPEETPPVEPSWGAPISDALPFLFCLSLLYLALKQSKNRITLKTGNFLSTFK
jgi:hypothetical protein